MTIYTLDYIEQEAQRIQGMWNGSDEKMNYDGDSVDAEYFVNGAKELEKKLKEVRTLIMELSI